MLQQEQIKNCAVEIRGVENKGALDRSQECSVFCVYGQGISRCAKI